MVRSPARVNAAAPALMGFPDSRLWARSNTGTRGMKMPAPANRAG